MPMATLSSTAFNDTNSLHLLQKSSIPNRFIASLRFRPAYTRFKRSSLSVKAVSIEAPPLGGSVPPAIELSENALKHLNRMRSEKSEDLYLRLGVKQGGCSGMSYTMEFESKDNARPDDSLIQYDGFTIVCDPKSLLFLFGMRLDYSDALMGGGFSFKNPNATKTCGCGKSFAAEM